MHRILSGNDLIETLLERVSAAVAVFDRELRCLTVSAQFRSDFGLGDEAVAGRLPDEVFPDIGDGWRHVCERALAGERRASSLSRFAHKDGSVDWVRWTLDPWTGDDGKIAGVLLVSQVVTTEINRETERVEQERELNLLIDSAGEYAICLLDPDGRVSIWNQGAERLYGWTSTEVLGRERALFFEDVDKDRGAPGEQLECARKSEQWSGRGRRVRKDGTSFLADITLRRIVDDGGVITGFGEVVRDVTTEDRRTRELDAAAQQLGSILGTVPDAMIVIDENGVIESFSRTAEALFGYPADEVIGRNVSMLMPSPDREMHDSYMRHYRETGEKRIIGAQRRVIGRRKDGSTFPHELNVCETSGGGRQIFIGFLRDLTEREEREARVQKLQSELLHVSRVSALGTLATALAHELNQPLMAIANYVQSGAALLARGGTGEIELTRRALEEAGIEALRAGAIIHRLREFTSKGELSRTIEHPCELAEQACSLASAAAQAKGIHCELDISKESPKVLVDRVQIQQVILNLLRNALEAIDQRGIIRVASEDDGSMTQFTISDTGPGISDDRLLNLFEPFSGSSGEGMGLGLSICRTIVEAHGGRLWYDPSQSGGAAFHFTVPNAAPEGDAR